MIINHFLLIADDAVVFAPFAKGLKKLLDACSEFAAYKDDSSCSGDGFAPDWPWTDWARRRFDTPSRYITHNVIFNVNKSQCLIVQSRTALSYGSTSRLCGDALPYTESYKYLGHIINSNLADNADIMKQTRALYARANTIIHKFSAASLSTKLLLFKAYCTPLYGCQLWCSMFQYS